MMAAPTHEVETEPVAVTNERTFGGQTLVAPLCRVLVRVPDPVGLARWREFGWLAEPDPAIAADQHESLCELLRAAGAEVVHAGSDVAEDPDAVYVFDPMMTSRSSRAPRSRARRGWTDLPRSPAPPPLSGPGVPPP